MFSSHPAQVYITPHCPPLSSPVRFLTLPLCTSVSDVQIYELQDLDRKEAELEVNTRHDWMQDDLRSVPRAFN